ncbi:helix-turn-helix transcriptional regulator [Rhodovulum sp. DZ06]|uniref:helix-turn-helix transcriptional regulator n=1 Tax=Rhodovulum sp. DZ06 TaxID=3425126 RepID=UPI003D33D93D
MQMDRGRDVMIVTGARVFYAGLLGARMKPRKLGGAGIYVAPSGRFRLRFGDGPWQERASAFIPPWTAHEVASDGARIISLLIEPESVAPDALARLARDFGEAPDQAAIARLRAAPAAAAGRMETEDLDRLTLGRALAPRALDKRIAAALALIDEQGLEAPIAADDCAAAAGLSTSRFLHLFKDETGTAFRNHRAWRRARSFLHLANSEDSLTDAAFSLGYPDSSHFSRSIRKTFGLKPRSIRIGSKGLAVHAPPLPA